MHVDLVMNNTVNGMNILNFKMLAMHAETVKQYKVWLDNLVQQ